MIDWSSSISGIDKFLESSEIIGIIIGQSDPINNPNQLHCGIVYKYQNKFNAIHLAWHYFLKHDGNPNCFPKYLFVKSNIHQYRQNSIAAMCRLILNLQNEIPIPYGLLYSGGSFTKEGILCLDSRENGLTCATFVLAVFKSCDIQLIDIDRWEQRDSDSEWHKSIIESLQRTKVCYNISDLHIENVNREVGCARFRPEEVAISSAFKEIPAQSKDIIKQGEVLRSMLN